MSTENEKDYYDILEVTPTATLDEVRAARNLKLKFFHPDRYQHDPELRAEAERKTKGINRAYEVLGDPESRARYDREKGYAPSQEARLSWLYDQAILLLGYHRWQGAIDHLEGLLAIDPEYRDAARLLQQARAALNQQLRESEAQAATEEPAGLSTYCEACGVDGQTWKVEYRQNIGALVMRFHKKIEGDFCASCSSKYFWEYSLTTLFLGWWGVISFFVTPFLLLGNVISYLPSMTRGKRVLFLALLLAIPLVLCLWLSGAFQWLGAVLPDALEPLGGTASNGAPAPSRVVMTQVTATPSPRRQNPTPLPPTPSRTPMRATATEAALPPGSPGADRVIAFNPGPGVNALPGHEYNILGAQDGVEKTGYPGFVQLGKNGSILVAFADNVIVDGLGADFVVYGESAEDDYLWIEVSDNGTRWRAFSKTSESPGGLDLRTVFLEQAVYVRLTDTGTGNSTGAEVDAIVANHSGPGIRAGLPTLPDAFAKSNLVLREGPSSKMKEVGRVKALASLEVLGRDQSATWAKIRELPGQTGWCKASELALNVSLSSLAVAAGPPTPVPDWLGRIPRLQATVTSLRFYESGMGGTPLEQRKYSNRFSGATTRFVNYEVSLSYPAPDRRLDCTIVAWYFKPNGSPFGQTSLDTYVLTSWTSSVHNYGYGWAEAGNWPAGTYAVVLSVDGSVIAQGSFTIY